MDKTKYVFIFMLPSKLLTVFELVIFLPSFSNHCLLLHAIILMALQAFYGSACCFHSHLLHSSSSTTVSPPFLSARRFQSCPSTRKSLKLNCSSSGNNDDQDYLLDAPVSVGDGFSFSGGKYSDGPSPSDEWFKQGKMVKAYSIPGTGEKAKDPIFGLAMGAGSQATGDHFSGSADNPLVILIHGFPSQVSILRKIHGVITEVAVSVWLINRWLESRAYSYRKVLPVLSKDYHAIAFDWLGNDHSINSFLSGFGFSDKPQPRYGFDYTLDEYVSSLESLIDELAVTKVSLVVQGYFSPVVVKYASIHQDKLSNLILLNPPLTAKHAKLPPTLSIFSNFLLGEIFSQDPLRASDKALTSCGPYKMKEEDAMVYRRPYLTSGSSGFALNAISRNMSKDLKRYVEDMHGILKDKNWKVQTTLCWGQRDRWLNYDGVEDFSKDSNHKLIEVPTAGHHVQEDCGEEVGQLICRIISRNSSI
ncbi:unnamed protein product [Sphenostylis stenocarpa]|uniref:AB hydrolase-1 domain-containing protein n=1 Tax=Sphenostylis stenocarpa TaxID=92480 RepID=A0AA86T2P3_9FABA|nr:unnamed protein product [Sphenostylis stenocarpa]